MDITFHIPSALSASFAKLINAPDGDIKFLIGVKETVRYGHSLVLKTRYKYFETMLTSDFKEKSEGIIRKPNIEVEVFDLILRFIYTSHVKLPSSQVIDVVNAAAELAMTDLLAICEPVIIPCLTHNNVFSFLMMSALHNLDKLRAACQSYICSHVGDLAVGQEILTLDSTQLQKLLAMDKFRVSELNVWTLAIRWAWHQHLDSVGEPLPLKTPASPGRLLVKTFDDEDAKDSVDSEPGEKKSSIMIPPGLAGTFDGENEQDYVMEMSTAAHQRLRSTVAPLLSSIRFHTMEIDQFHRFVEYTCLVPSDLCLKVYRCNTLAIKAPEHLTTPRIYPSTLLATNEWWNVLKLIPTPKGVPPVLKKLYHASRNGFSAAQFHANCDNRGATLTVAKTSTGHIIGGFSTTPWSIVGGDVLLGVALVYYIAFKKSSFIRDSGPTFGAGPDLKITSNGKRSEVHCESYTDLKLSKVLGSSFFDVVDYEVFQILF
ncbi:hypothetical protein DFQ27_009334 [Actinomortierella ambigua]|uniref:BTB domain-containing protein n=1 Tax=Actinomortierella ambigua TaxID=1343610 RepID=A0A9P6PND0_9FUNG|nr:hypothetical protein DFQ27_009334 [Actinomortierella ambigua]